MKNKKLLIAAAATALSAVLCFSACGGVSIKDDAKFSDIYSTAAYKESSVVTLKDLSSVFDGYTYIGAYNDCIYYGTKTTTTYDSVSSTEKTMLTYYNIKTGNSKTLTSTRTDYNSNGTYSETEYSLRSEVKGMTDTYAVLEYYSSRSKSGSSYTDVSYYKEVTVYNVKDDSIVFTISNNDSENRYSGYLTNKISYIENDFYRADDKVYYMIDGVWKYVCTYYDNALIFAGDLSYHNGYFYLVDEEEGYVKVYNSSMKEYVTFMTPEGAKLTNDDVFCLNADKFIVQYKIPVSVDSKKYNLVEKGEKYNLITVKYDLGEKKAKEIDFDYMISDSVLTSELGEDNYFNSNVKGYLECQPIKDKQVVETEKDVVYLAFDEENAFTLIPTVVDGQIGTAQMFSKDLFAVGDDDYLVYFVDANGENLKDVGYYDYSSFHYEDNDYYVFMKYNDGSIEVYDKFTKEKFELAEEETIVEVYTRSFITKTEKTYKNDKDVEITYYEYKLYKDGATTGTVICDTKPNEDGNRAYFVSLDDMYSVEGMYFVSSADEKTGAIYNEIGDKLIEFVNTDTVTYDDLEVNGSYISIEKTTKTTEGNKTTTLYYALTK